MAEKNIGAVLVGTKKLEVKEVPTKEPGPGEVLVAVHSVGICGSDVHYWSQGRIGNFVVNGPMILGHESSGTVIKVGPGVKHLKEGDRVAMEPAVPCYKCYQCLHGRYNMCADIRCLSTPPYDGDICRYHVHDANFCFKLPDHMTFEEGALLEPISVGVYACRRAGVTLGTRVLITGAGPIGLVNILVARAMGADKIVITDLVQQRLDVAKQIGADETVLVDRDEPVEKTAERIKPMFSDREGADVCIECCGAESSVNLCITVARTGGCVVLVGMGKPTMTIPLLDAAMREVDIRGVFRYLNCYPAAMSLIAQRKVNALQLITHRFNIEESAKAFEIASDPKSNSIKVMIHCADEKNKPEHAK